jgi:hypothetical protein
MTEKFYSVIAEFADGATKTVPVRGGSSGEAFRKVRETPGVRRVGRVTEVTQRDHLHTERDGGLIGAAAVTAPAPGRSSATESQAPEAPAAPRSNGIGHTISGPRTVVYAPPGRGEQPFKNLVIPPERLAKPRPDVSPKPKAHVKPVAAAPVQPAAQVPVAGPISMPQAPASTKYRIHKSRRRDGLPYLLQRGLWQQVGGKRTFDVQWEKGFDQREDAERHLEWVQQTEQELAEFQQSA